MRSFNLNLFKVFPYGSVFSFQFKFGANDSEWTYFGKLSRSEQLAG